MENKELPAYDEVVASERWRWPAIVFLLGTPTLAVLGLILDLRWEGFRLTDLIPFLVLYALCGLSITVGYHRLFSHRAFKAPAAIQWPFLVFGAAAMQNSALDWCSNHRYHHRYVDGPGDPYAITKGFFWAHMGWMFKVYPHQYDRDFRNAADLKANALVQWQARWYWTIALVAGMGVPALIGAAYGRPFAGLVWGGLIRLVAGHHVTFLINSWAHTFGRATHARGGTARDSHWLAFLSFGEGYHSFHHAYEGDYRAGIRAYEWDPAKWLIRSLAAVGLASDLKRTAPASLTSGGGSRNVKKDGREIVSTRDQAEQEAPHSAARSHDLVSGDQRPVV